MDRYCTTVAMLVGSDTPVWASAFGWSPKPSRKNLHASKAGKVSRAGAAACLNHFEDAGKGL